MGNISNDGQLRKRVYKRDCYKCVKCGSRKQLTIDHIVPSSKGGCNVIENLQTMCEKCNYEKADRAIVYKNGQHKELKETEYLAYTPLRKKKAKDLRPIEFKVIGKIQL